MSRLALCLCVAAPLCAAAEPAPAPAAATGQAAEPSQKKISVEFRGNLRDALKKIATEGGLNLVVTGDLAKDSEVYLKDVTAEDALRTVAQAYELKLQRAGSIWTLRPMTQAEAKEAAEAAPAPAPAPQVAPVPPVPGVPAVPPAVNQQAPEAAKAPEIVITPGMSPDQIEEAMRKADEFAQATEERAQALREQAEEEAQAIQEQAQSKREAAQEQAEALREAAQEARERAREAREHAREVEQRAREAIREATRNVKLGQAVGAGAVEVKEGEVVDDAVAYGGPLKIFGHVQGDAVSLGGDVTLGPKSWVEGDVVAVGGTIHRADGAVVDGDVQAVGGAIVGQAVKESVKEVREVKHERHNNDGSAVAQFLVWFMVLFGTGFIASLFVPNRMKAVQEEIRRNPLMSGTVGFLSALALIPLTVLLVITLIGIPVAILVLWPAAMLAFGIGVSAVASEVGMRLPFLRGKKTQALVLAVGLLVMLLIGFIPVLGPIVMTLAGLIGFGAIVRTRFGQGPKVGGPSASASDLPTGVPV